MNRDGVHASNLTFNNKINTLIKFQGAITTQCEVQMMRKMQA